MIRFSIIIIFFNIPHQIQRNSFLKFEFEKSFFFFFFGKLEMARKSLEMVTRKATKLWRQETVVGGDRS
jgi:hypothetical protein